MNSLAYLKRNVLYALFCVIFSMLIGCVSVREHAVFSDATEGQITIFLKVPEITATDITFDLSAVSILSDDGTYREIMNIPVSVNSVAVTGSQIRICEQALQEGRYSKLQLRVTQAFIQRKDTLAHLALPPEGIEIDIDAAVRRGQNTSLFLHWNADGSVVDGYLFRPLLTVRGQTPELSSLLIYVTNEESNNVSVLNRQTGETVATIMVGKKPRGIAASPGRERPRIYVANTGSNSVSVIDPTTNKVETEIPVRFGRQPEAIAVVAISPERDLLFVSNFGSNNISVIDAALYQEIERISVGEGPVALSADPAAESLSASRFLGAGEVALLRRYREKFFNVYVANKNSRSVSVIRMDISRGKADAVMHVNVEWNPVALSVDYPRGKVYVANYNHENLSVLDIPQLVSGNHAGAVSSISNIGTSVTSIIADTEIDRLYLLKESTGEVMIIRPFSEAFGNRLTTMSPVTGTIPVGSLPRSMLLDPEGRKIYVVNRGSDDVSVVDKTTRRVEQVIPVGKRPYGIAMIQY